VYLEPTTDAPTRQGRAAELGNDRLPDPAPDVDLDEPELAGYLRIEERDLEAGGLSYVGGPLPP
jgi:hypothetical protein